jgi:hypothetical protein
MFQGGRSCVPASTSIGAEPSISQYQPSRNICAGVSQAEIRNCARKKENRIDKEENGISKEKG